MAVEGHPAQAAVRGSRTALEFRERFVDLDALLLEVTDLIFDLVERKVEFGRDAIGDAVLCQHGADFRKGKSELLALSG